MKDSVRARRFGGALCLFVGLVSLGGCASGRLTSRYVDTPKSNTFAYGAPTNTSYEIETESQHDRLRLYIYEYSQCDRIPVTLVERREELVRGDDVVEVKPLGTVQIAKKPEGAIPCNARYARDVDVSLVVGDASYSIGRTDAEGAVDVNLASFLERGVRDEALPESGELRIRSLGGGPGRSIGKIALRQLKVHEEQVARALAEFDSILKKGPALGPDDIARSYVLYEQLRSLAARDPRFRGAAARFWELFLNRKRDEATERLGRNLKALNDAKALLQGAGFAAIPIYAQVAVNSGVVEQRAVEWSQWELLSALRGQPGLCQAPLNLENLGGYGLSPSALFAVRYLQFSQGDGVNASIQGLCSRVVVAR